MSDLLAPIYVVFDANEADAFWGLVGVMEMMVGIIISFWARNMADTSRKAISCAIKAA